MEKRELSGRGLKLATEKLSGLPHRKMIFMATAIFIWLWVKYRVKRCADSCLGAGRASARSPRAQGAVIGMLQGTGITEESMASNHREQENQEQPPMP